MQELVEFVDFSEIELEEVLCGCLKIGTVHAVGQGGDTCRGKTQRGTDLWGGVYILILVYLFALLSYYQDSLLRQFVL